MENFIQLFIWVLAVHFVGDFAFQSQWMSIEKGKSWEVNLYHAATYTATFVLFGPTLSLLSFFLIFASHFVIDPLKSRYGIVKYIWQDQLLHIAVIIFVLLVTK